MSDKFMKIKELLEKKTGRKAVIKKMVKNNGTSYTGIFVEFESTNTLPVINLDAFYDECNAQKLSIDEIRNEQMHRYIASKQDRGVIAFWDGESKGTFQSFDLSKKYNNQIRVIKYKNIEK